MAISYSRAVLKSILALSLVWGAALPASAETPQPVSSSATAEQSVNEEVITFSPIMVTATRVEADLHNIPMSVSVVGEKQIEERPGATTAEQFVDMPGVSYTSGKGGPGNNSMVTIRGLEAGRVLYLIDGVRQNSIFKEDMNKGLMNVDPDDIERIEVIKGPASSLYGSDAIGGVVNIITKKGGKGKPVSFKISSMFDSSTMGIEPRASVSGDYNGFSYRLSGSMGSANDRELPGGGKADHSSYSTQSFAGQLGYAWDKGSLNFTAQHYDSDTQEMSAIYDWNDKRINLYDQDDPRVYYLGDFPRNQRDTYTGTLELQDLTDNLKNFKAVGFYQFRDTIQRGDTANGYPPLSGDNKLQDISDLYGATVQTNWSFFDSHSVTLGFDYTYEDLTNHTINTFNPAQYTFKGLQENMALFIQDEWTIFKDWRLTGGLRQSWIRTKLTRYDQDPSFEGSDSQDNLSGNLGLVYTGFEDLALRAQYSQGFRVPDMGSQFTGAGEYLLPNPNLKPETSENYEIGARYTGEHLTFDTSVFYNKIDDAMTGKVLYYKPNGFAVSTTVNAATYKAYGFEMAAAWNIPDTNFTPYGNLTILHTEMDHGWYSTDDNRVPGSWGTLGVKWDRRFDEGLRLYADLSCRMSDGYKQDGGSDAIWFTHEGGKTVDFSMGMELGKEEKFKAALSLKNLLDEPYDVAYYYYPGFHAVLNLSYEF